MRLFDLIDKTVMLYVEVGVRGDIHFHNKGVFSGRKSEEVTGWKKEKVSMVIVRMNT